jgi:enoyl-CoA hydratase/carnithine racemase
LDGFASIDGSATISVEARGAIEILTLNRPESFNALNARLIGELGAYFVGLHERTNVRVVLLRGAGPNFCAGADLKEVRSKEARVHTTLKRQKSIGHIVKMMRSCPQPIIGLGHGAACGGGFSFLMACDVRYAAPSLKMNAAYVRIGLGGCELSSSYLLPRLVGMSVASEFLLTGRFMTAERAKAVNLVSEIVDEDKLLEKGLELAGDMLRASPLGLRLTKDALNFSIDAPSMDAAMAMEDRQQVLLTFTDDYAEARSAFTQRRTPTFNDR